MNRLFLILRARMRDPFVGLLPLPVRLCFCLCLSVYLFVNWITQKLLIKSLWKFV